MLSILSPRGMTTCSLFIALILTGCAPTQSNIKARLSDDSIPSFSVNGVVAVTTDQGLRNRVFEDESISVDYQQIAQSSADTLRVALKQNSGMSTGGEHKSIKYTISSIDCLAFGACFINFVVETGDGDVRGFMAEGKGLLLTGSLRKAVENTPMVVFSDKAILDYIAR